MECARGIGARIVVPRAAVGMRTTLATWTRQGRDSVSAYSRVLASGIAGTKSASAEGEGQNSPRKRFPSGKDRAAAWRSMHARDCRVPQGKAATTEIAQPGRALPQVGVALVQIQLSASRSSARPARSTYSSFAGQSGKSPARGCRALVFVSSPTWPGRVKSARPGTFWLSA